MFTRRSATLAAGLVAASLLLAPGTARAQFMLGGGYGGGYGGYAGYANPYFRGSPFGLGFGFGGLGFGGLGFGGLGYGGMGYGGMGYGGMGYGGFGGYGGMYRPLTGMSGYGSYYSPMNFASLSASAGAYAPYYGFNNVGTLYPSGLTPSVLSGLSYASALAAYPAGLRTSTGFPAVTPALDQVGTYFPRVRSSLYPAVAVAPGSNLLRQNLGTPAAYGAASDKGAHIEVVLPTPDAQVWFQGKKTTRTGKVREFESPALAPGGTYSYAVRATWTEGDQPVTRTRNVTVRAGEHVRVDFTAK